MSVSATRVEFSAAPEMMWFAMKISRRVTFEWFGTLTVAVRRVSTDESLRKRMKAELTGAKTVSGVSDEVLFKALIKPKLLSAKVPLIKDATLESSGYPAMAWHVSEKISNGIPQGVKLKHSEKSAQKRG